MPLTSLKLNTPGAQEKIEQVIEENSQSLDLNLNTETKAIEVEGAKTFKRVTIGGWLRQKLGKQKPDGGVGVKIRL